MLLLFSWHLVFQISFWTHVICIWTVFINISQPGSHRTLASISRCTMSLSNSYPPHHAQLIPFTSRGKKEVENLVGSLTPPFEPMFFALFCPYCSPIELLPFSFCYQRVPDKSKTCASYYIYITKLLLCFFIIIWRWDVCAFLHEQEQDERVLEQLTLLCQLIESKGGYGTMLELDGTTKKLYVKCGQNMNS